MRHDAIDLTRRVAESFRRQEDDVAADLDALFPDPVPDASDDRHAAGRSPTP